MKNEIKWACLADNHGNHAHKPSVEAFFRFVKGWKPEIRVHGGDCFDFACFRTKASEEERRGGLMDDINSGIDLLDRYKPTHWLKGNHDQRLWDLLDSDDEKISDLVSPIASRINDSVKGAIVKPYDKRRGVIKVGDLHIIHGYTSGVGAVRTAANAYGRVAMGHIHSQEHVAVPGYPNVREGWSIGCLCDLNLKYARGTLGTLRQSWGWSFGYIRNGRTSVYQAKYIPGIGFETCEAKFF